MAVTFGPQPGYGGGVSAPGIGPAAAPALSAASPLAGLSSALSGGQSADPGMTKLVQAILKARMKPPVPAGGAIDPNGTNGMQGPVPLPQPAAPAAATAGIPPQ